MNIEEYMGYKIIWYDFDTPTTYDGSQLRCHYVAKNLKVIGDSFFIFRGQMNVSKNEMVDLKDIIQEGHLADILISSGDAINFIIEEFDIQPPNIEIAYYRLRIFVQVLMDELNEKNIKVKRKGTDIYIMGKKLNVGIASVGRTSSKIHFGLNVRNIGIPKHVNATSLFDLGVEEEQLVAFAKTIAIKYIDEINNIKQDIRKTQPL